MLRRAAVAVVVLAIAGAALAWFVTAPEPLSAAQLPAHDPDVANGERIFYAGGCSSCHAAPDAKGEDKLRLGGGRELNTDFGIFRVPNISPDAESGIGGWSTLDFVNAVTRGVSPGGAHFYPSFPYSSYTRMTLEDVVDLKGFIDTLAPISNRVTDHDLGFPFNIRRGVGVWKFLYFSSEPVLSLANASEAVLRGQYLAEGPGHCGECHTSRDALGGLRKERWLAGAPNPEGRGTVPNITPGPDGLAWSQDEIVDAFKTGFTPEFDTLGGSMALVQTELAHLPDEDLQAIATYLKAVPPHPDAVGQRSDGAD
jgi:mono/diheme cytochrome c family protein